MASFPVKWISSTMRGAPAISGTPGTLIAALDAFFLHGWGQVSASQIEVTGGVATATVNAGDTFVRHAVIEVAGASASAINGQARVTGGTSTTVTWITDAADGTYTGTITIKYAPVGGWEKVYSKTNVAVYRSTDPAGSRFYYRVNDTGATMARIVGYEDMTSVDDGTAPFPTAAQSNGGRYWYRSTSAGSTPSAYCFIADSRAVLSLTRYGVTWAADGNWGVFCGFGDMQALSPSGDAWAAAVAYPDAATHSIGALEANVSDAIYWARAKTGMGGAVATSSRPYVGSESAMSGRDSTLGACPSSVDGQLKLSRRWLASSASNRTPRAHVPGLLHVPQSDALAAIGDGTVIDGTGEWAGRLLLALSTDITSYSGAAQGLSVVDISGPWR